MLTASPIFKIDDPFKDFFICTDACKKGLGQVLIQKYYLVGYESRKLKERKRNYTTHDLELASIIHVLNMWQQDLIGIRFLLVSDNISLKYLFDQHNLNAIQSR